MHAKMQFSLRWIFVVTACVAIVCGQAVAFPDGLAEVVGLVVTLFLPTVFVTGIVYARGAIQAFWIGALVWFVTAWMAFFSLGQIAILDGGRIDLCLCWLLAGASGMLAVVVRWLTSPHCHRSMTPEKIG
jgi:hypothetical protein